MAEDLDGGDARAERLDARLARLETRLEMLETAIRAEVGRIQLVAENMSSLTTDLSGTVGGTRNLVDLVNDIGDRLTLLHTLESSVTSASENVAEQVRGHLEEAAPIWQRVNGQLLELAARVEQIASHTSAIAAHLAHMRSEQPDPAVAVAPLYPRIDQLAQILGGRIEQLAAELAELRQTEAEPVAAAAIEAGEARPDEPDPLAPLIDRVAVVVDGVSSLRATVEELAGAMSRDGARTSQRLDELAASIRRIEDTAEAQPAVAEPATAEPGLGFEAQFNDVLSGLAFAVEQIEASTRAGDANATRINERLDQLNSDVQRTRNELDTLRSPRVVEPPRSDELSGASAALLASAAAALSRLEGRIESEFDIVERQTEALGTLIAQTIEAIERVEHQIVGVQPFTEKMRAAAAHTLELLRTNRRRGGPPELNR